MLLLNHKKGVKGLISDDEQRLIKQALTPETEVFKRQQMLINHWRERNLWVQCDCKDHEEFDRRPVMSLRRLQSGLIIFAILPTSEPHETSCPFYRILKYRQYEEGQQLRQNRKRTDFIFHRHSVEKADQEEDDTDNDKGRVSKPSMPGLQRFLINLVHQANTHIFTEKTKLKEAAYLYRLKLAAEEFTINKRFKLSDYLYMDFADQQAALHRLKVTEQYWVGSARPHCVFLLPIDEVVKSDAGVTIKRLRFVDDDIQTDQLLLPKECEVILPGRYSVNKPNPSIALVTFADVSTTDTTFYAPAKALVLPVVSKDHLLIVESNFERVVAKVLRRCQKFLAKRAKVQFFVRVAKPLDDLRAPVSGNACRPDFVLEINNRKIILEVMGSHDEDYLERKRRTVPIMEEIAPVYEFDALQASNDGQLEQRAYAAVRGALNQLLKDDPLFDDACWIEMQ
ncbi:DUF1173 family protein [Vibrio vulnificus]|uniref:DUF1173 family protein n=1 Tax=Vibrio vulnificus TaxID=672 RepID=UPI00102365AA|nr:DUF1173 family protein [Vibrio vulnificus]RZQ33229.1 DUF1173 family protein [Vibrio vulnificus]HAS6231042.1 DUF1173 family protein [Vibrio vulnificus]HDY7776798.1 DUF1173 family protein [Vibrio vulnificus]